MKKNKFSKVKLIRNEILIRKGDSLDKNQQVKQDKLNKELNQLLNIEQLTLVMLEIFGFIFNSRKF